MRHISTQQPPQWGGNSLCRPTLTKKMAHKNRFFSPPRYTTPGHTTTSQTKREGREQIITTEGGGLPDQTNYSNRINTAGPPSNIIKAKG